MPRPFSDLTLAVVFVGLLVGPTRGEEPSPRIKDFLLKKIEPRLGSKEYVGIVVGIHEGETGTSSVIGFGSTEAGTTNKPDGRTMFEIGSITKVFTGILLAESAVSGRARLNEPVVDLLPAGAISPRSNAATITLEDLATHYSGLPRIPASVAARAVLGLDPYAEIREKDVFAATREWKPTDAPNSKHAYSNWGFSLLGLAIAHRSNTTYDQCLRRVILDPLGMKDTCLELDEPRKQRWAKPHVKGGSLGKTWHFDAMAPCGGLSSNADEMLLFLQANLKTEDVAPPLGESMRLAMTPRRAAGGTKSRIGLGWIITERSNSGHEVIWHNGGTGGYRSFAGFQPKTRRAVIVLGNTDVSVDDLGFSLFDELERARKPVAIEKP